MMQSMQQAHLQSFQQGGQAMRWAKVFKAQAAAEVAEAKAVADAAAAKAAAAEAARKKAEKEAAERATEEIKNGYRKLSGSDRARLQEILQKKIAEAEAEYQEKYWNTCDYCDQRTRKETRDDYDIRVEEITCPYGYSAFRQWNKGVFRRGPEYIQRLRGASQYSSFPTYSYKCGNNICPKVKDAAQKVEEAAELRGELCILKAVIEEMQKQEDERELREIRRKAGLS